MFAINATPPGHDALMAHIAQTLREQPEFNAKFSRIMGELCYYSWVDLTEDMDVEREAFLTSNAKHRARIVEIGEELNKTGGLSLMQFTASVIGPMFKGPVDLRTLEYAWDGIGEWRC